jgi:hypothetical protein
VELNDKYFFFKQYNNKNHQHALQLTQIQCHVLTSICMLQVNLQKWSRLVRKCYNDCRNEFTKATFRKKNSKCQDEQVNKFHKTKAQVEFCTGPCIWGLTNRSSHITLFFHMWRDWLLQNTQWTIHSIRCSVSAI